MEQTSTMNFLQERDFGQTLNATLQFYKENWKGMLRALVYYCMPFAVLMVVSIYFFDLFGFMSAFSSYGPRMENFDYESFGYKAAIVGLFAMMFYITLSGTVYSYCSLYHERKGNTFTTAEVGNRLMSTIWVYIKTFLFLIIAVTILVALAALMMYSLGVGGAILLGFVLVCAGIYLSVSLFPLFIVQIIEDKGLFEGLSRSFYIVRGNWWRTFGIIIVVSFLIAMVSMIPQLILQSMMGVSAFNVISDSYTPENMGTYMLANSVLSTVIRLAVGPIMIIAFVFHYFSLVENKEKSSLLDQVINIGGNSDTNNPETNPYKGEEEAY